MGGEARWFSSAAAGLPDGLSALLPEGLELAAGRDTDHTRRVAEEGAAASYNAGARRPVR